MHARIFSDGYCVKYMELVIYHKIKNMKLVVTKITATSSI